MEWLRTSSTRREFERFVADNTPTLLRTAYLITWDLAEAEDVLQEVWLTTAQRWSTIRSMEFPRAYVRRTLINRAVRDARRGADLIAVDPTDLEGLQDQRPDSQLSMIDTRSEIIWMLGRLSRAHRVVIVLRYFQDMTESEIAEQLNWPVGTVKSNAARALENLQRRAGVDSRTPASPSCNHRLTS